MTISEQLRETIAGSGLTNYRIAKDLGIQAAVLGRWMNGSRDNIRSDTLDALAEYFGLELQPKKAKRKPKAE